MWFLDVMRVDEKGLVRPPGLGDSLLVLLGKNQTVGLLYAGGAVESWSMRLGLGAMVVVEVYLGVPL